MIRIKSKGTYPCCFPKYTGNSCFVLVQDGSGQWHGVEVCAGANHQQDEDNKALKIKNCRLWLERRGEMGNNVRKQLTIIGRYPQLSRMLCFVMMVLSRTQGPEANPVESVSSHS